MNPVGRSGWSLWLEVRGASGVEVGSLGEPMTKTCRGSGTEQEIEKMMVYLEKQNYL